jgi:hypothetical protein
MKFAGAQGKIFRPMKVELLIYDIAETALELVFPNSEIMCIKVGFNSLEAPY